MDEGQKSILRGFRHRRGLSWYWPRRAVRVSLWWMANPERWESLRKMILAERGLSDEAVDDARMPV